MTVQELINLLLKIDRKDSKIIMEVSGKLALLLSISNQQDTYGVVVLKDLEHEK